MWWKRKLDNRFILANLSSVKKNRNVCPRCGEFSFRHGPDWEEMNKWLKEVAYKNGT